MNSLTKSISIKSKFFLCNYLFVNYNYIFKTKPHINIYIFLKELILFHILYIKRHYDMLI